MLCHAVQGALSWQQAILFPDNVNKLVATRMDTCEVCCEEVGGCARAAKGCKGIM